LFHHSSFYLYSIPFITPESIHTGSGGSWKWRTLGMAVPGSGGPSPLTHNMRKCLISQEFEAGRKSGGRLVCGDIMCATFLLGDIIVMRHFCPRPYDGGNIYRDILFATFSTI